MKAKNCIASLFVLSAVFFCTFPVHSADESIIFLHHSTGEGVYYQGGTPEWIDEYNAAHGAAYAITERNYPNDPYPWENYPYDYWHLWVNGACSSANPNIECLNTLTQSYDVIIFKHCFPGSAIEPDTGTSDIGSATKTLENYKVQYRALRDLMDSYPQNLFMVWTLAPLHRLATDPEQAARAKEFVDWVRQEYLTEDGNEHANIAIFDFWAIVAEDDSSPARGKFNCLRYEYESSHLDSDSHPNEAGNKAAGPEFAQAIVTECRRYFDNIQPDNETDGDDDDDVPCIAEQILGKKDPRLDALRNLRDTVLARHWTGRQITELYYCGSALLSPVIAKSPFLEAAAKKALEAALPLVRRAAAP